MKIFRDESAIRAAATSSEDAELARLIADRIDELAEYECDLAELVNIFVIESGDRLPQIDIALGFSLTEHPIEGIDVHSSWYELTIIVSDDGFGFVIYVPIRPDIDPELLEVCSTRATERLP